MSVNTTMRMYVTVAGRDTGMCEVVKDIVNTFHTENTNTVTEQVQWGSSSLFSSYNSGSHLAGEICAYYTVFATIQVATFCFQVLIENLWEK